MGRWNKCKDNYGGYNPAMSPPGTVLNVYIPAGAVINLLNLFEVSSPQGINLLIRVPFLGGSMGLSDFMSAITSAGGMVSPVTGNFGNMNYYQPYAY